MLKMCCVRAHLIDLHQINTKIYHLGFKVDCLTDNKGDREIAFGLEI